MEAARTAPEGGFPMHKCVGGAMMCLIVVVLTLLQNRVGGCPAFPGARDWALAALANPTLFLFAGRRLRAMRMVSDHC